MAQAIQDVSIRVGTTGVSDTNRQLVSVGDTADRAFKRVREATEPASKSLVALNVVGEQVKYGLENLAEGSGTLGSSLIRLGPYGLAAAAALGAVGIAVEKGLEEFRATEKAINGLNAALIATDSSSGVTTQSILELGEAVEKNTLFKKTDILSAASALTSFQNVAGTTFTRALKLSTDLAVRLGTDIPTAAEQLGHALDSPTDGLGRLERKFTDLSPTQKDAIASFVKLGDVASAQAVILEHLEAKTRGLAEAQNKGLTGTTNELHDAWSSLLESFGRTVGESDIAQASLRALTGVVIGLRQAIDPTLAERKTQLEKDIAGLENSWLSDVDRWAFGTAPNVDALKAELKDVNGKLAAEQQKSTDEQNDATQKADKAATGRRNQQLLELQKKYLKESEDLTLTSQQKIYKEAADRRQEILARNKSPENNAATQAALAALDASTRSKIADANKKSGESDDAKKRRGAIDEINRAVLQTKPSFDVAKAALDDWKEKLVEDLGGAGEENQKYIDLIDQIYTVRLKQIYDKSIIDSDKWADGASRGLKRYGDEATNAAKNAEELFSGAAKKVEDTLVDMVSSGEFSVKKIGDLIQSLEQDILRQFLRESVTGPIAKGLSGILGGGSSGGGGGGIFSSVGSWIASQFHDGGVVGHSSAPQRAVPAHVFTNAPRYHSGLMPDEFPAILQRGETVLPKGKQPGGFTINFNVTSPDAKSFMDSQGQMMAKLAGSLQRYSKRNS